MAERGNVSTECVVHGPAGRRPDMGSPEARIRWSLQVLHEVQQDLVAVYANAPTAMLPDLHRQLYELTLRQGELVRMLWPPACKPAEPPA